MNKEQLYATVDALMSEGKGILAADESVATAGKRLALAKQENTVENRRAFRELIVSAPNLEEYISGIILHDETIHDNTSLGIAFADLVASRGMVVGIKVDNGTVPFCGFPEETVTEGMDGLADRMRAYYALGARFAKWRAVFHVDPVPSRDTIAMNAMLMAYYASIAQEVGLVPIVEPEVLYDGSHTIDASGFVTHTVLAQVCDMLAKYHVDLKGVIIKTSMILSGKESPLSEPEDVGMETVKMLHLSVPQDIGGIVFLSGGQEAKQATKNLNAIAKQAEQSWRVSSSFSRALQEPMLREWKGKEENSEIAQKALVFRAKMNGLAMKGDYNKEQDV